MGRIRLASRLTLIVVAAFVLVQMLVAVGYFLDRRKAAEATTFTPLVGQIAALVQVLDRVPAVDHSLVLRAATGVGFLPRIVREIPHASPDVHGLPLVERRLKKLVDAEGERKVLLYLTGGTASGPRMRFRDLAGASLHVIVGLKEGSYLEVDATGDLTMRLFGIPAGLVAGILGLVVALIALAAVRRETRPLSQLTEAIKQIGPTLEVRRIAESGAPDVRSVIRAVNEMQARIVELMRNRTMVIGAISHDLRTFITRLRLRFELLPQSEQRTKAMSDLDDMQSLLEDALVFAQSSYADVETVDLAAIARSEHESRAASGADVSLAGAERQFLVRGTSAAARRVVANLVSNALTYGKCADISLQRSGEWVELRVEDRGPGIAISDRAAVFEPFFRLEPSRSRQHGGAGLGLSIVRQIVDAYRGTISIEDRPGGGARIRVFLQDAPGPVDPGFENRSVASSEGRS